MRKITVTSDYTVTQANIILDIQDDVRINLYGGNNSSEVVMQNNYAGDIVIYTKVGDTIEDADTYTLAEGYYATFAKHDANWVVKINDGSSSNLSSIQGLADVIIATSGEDITDILQSALDNTDNPYLPNGTYYIDRIEFLKANTHLILGKNTKLILNNDVNEEAIEVLADGCSITNLQLDGNRDNQVGSINTLHGIRVAGNDFTLNGSIFISKCGDSGIAVISVDGFKSNGKLIIADCNYISFFANTPSVDHENIYISDIEVYWNEYPNPDRTAIGFFGGLGVSKWKNITIDKIKTTFDSAYNVMRIGFTTKACENVAIGNVNHYGGSAGVSFASETVDACVDSYYIDTPNNEASCLEVAGGSNIHFGKGVIKGSSTLTFGLRCSLGNGVPFNSVSLSEATISDCNVGVRLADVESLGSENVTISSCNISASETGISTTSVDSVSANSNIISALKTFQIEKSNSFNAIGNIIKNGADAICRITSSEIYEHDNVNISNNIIPTGTVSAKWIQILSLATVGGNVRFKNNINADYDIEDALNNIISSISDGSPEGSITAGVGSTHRRADGGTSTTLYIKETGTGNTGWVAK